MGLTYSSLGGTGHLCIMKWLMTFAMMVAGVLATRPEDQAWLDAKATEAGVVTLDSGLMYKIVKSGDGQHHPKVSTPCECHYKGTFTDGKTFDSSYDRGEPTTFAPNQVIKGWTEAMQLMVEGDHYELYIPSDLAYGDSQRGPIPGGAALVFELEL